MPSVQIKIAGGTWFLFSLLLLGYAGVTPEIPAQMVQWASEVMGPAPGPGALHTSLTAWSLHGTEGAVTVAPEGYLRGQRC